MPRLDIVESIKTGFIFVVGVIYIVLIGAFIVGSFWLYSISKVST